MLFLYSLKKVEENGVKMLIKFCKRIKNNLFGVLFFGVFFNEIILFMQNSNLLV